MKARFTIGLFLSVLILPGLTGCKPDRTPDCINIDVAAALKQTGKFPLSEMVTELEVIQLDTVRDAFFGNMISLSMTDHFFGFVCDQQEKAYLFDRSGRFIANIGRRGKGPGEYTEPNVLAISPDEKFIVVGDPWLGKLILYDMAGHFLREKVIKQDSPGWRFDKLMFADKSGLFVVFRRPVQAGPGYATIHRYDLDFRLEMKILPRTVNQEDVLSGYSYATLMPTREGTCFWEAGKDTVYYIDRKGTARPRYHLEIKNHCFDLERGQMKLYVPGQYDVCTKALQVLDLPGHLVVGIIENGGSRTLIIDKETNAAFAADRPIACDTSSSEGWVRSSIDNDVYGLEPLMLEQYIPERNELIARVRPGWTADSHDMACVRQRQVKFPEARDQLAKLVEDRTGLQNMAIVVMKLRK
jgi:hypothetical protein